MQSNDDYVLWPEATTQAAAALESGLASFCDPAASGVRASWVFGILNSGGSAGVPCRHSYIWAVATRTGAGSLGAPGREG